MHSLFFLCYNVIGDYMKIAIDKKATKIIKNDGNEYIYLFNDESLEELLRLKTHCIRYDKCNYVDINLTDYDIDCFKKAKITDKDYLKIEKKDFKIGIIIPNYNYEHTISKCLDSIAKQTYKNYEVIFVDDMSKDNSVNIAYTFIDKLSNIKIIELQQKRYNGGARNEGYLHLSDDVDYVYYIDSDDWLYDEYALEKINNKLQNKPDVLFVGIAKCKNGKISKSSIPKYKDKYEAIVGWSGSCGKVIKKKLATKQECLYNEGTLKEDRNQHCKICINMNDFALLQESIYVWNQDNYKSVTTIRDNVLWKTSTIRHWADTLELYEKYKGIDLKIDKILLKRVNQTRKEVLNGGDQQW